MILVEPPRASDSCTACDTPSRVANVVAESPTRPTLRAVMGLCQGCADALLVGLCLRLGRAIPAGLLEQVMSRHAAAKKG